MRVAKAKGRLRGKQPKLSPPAGSPHGRVAEVRRILQRGTRRPVRRREVDRVPGSRARRSPKTHPTADRGFNPLKRQYRPPRIRAISVVITTSLWLAGVPQDYPLFGTSPASARGRRPVSVIGPDWDVLRWVKPAGPVHSSRSGGSHRPDSTSPAEAAERALCGLPSHQRPVHAAERRGSGFRTDDERTRQRGEGQGKLCRLRVMATGTDGCGRHV